MILAYIFRDIPDEYTLTATVGVSILVGLLVGRIFAPSQHGDNGSGAHFWLGLAASVITMFGLWVYLAGR